MPGARADPVWSEAKDGPRVQEDTWTEVARRLMVLFSSGLRAKAADPKTSDKPSKAGEKRPRASDGHPLDRLDVLTVLQHLTTGVALDPGAGVAVMPMDGSRSAPNALLASQVQPAARPRG